MKIKYITNRKWIDMLAVTDSNQADHPLQQLWF